MRVIRSIKQMSNLSRKIRLQGKSIGFVPTMGALHAGHLSLIRKARKTDDFVVASIFVNPKQFGPKEDFKKYPRVFKKDIGLCKKEGVDVVFYPKAEAMYPSDYKTYVNVNDLSSSLCGKFRPGHFRGVATVVTKLFNIVQPDTAYFGHKDAQQAIIIQKMVSDLNIPVKIKVMPTIREKGGLALSSRNIYLSAQERADALVLSQALKQAQDLIKSGVKDTAKIIAIMKQLIRQKNTAKIDYIAIVDKDNLMPLKKISRPCLIALAARFGKTRLIDNMVINLSKKAKGKR